MWFTLVSGKQGGIRYCITNNGGYISNLKLHAIAAFSFQVGEKRCSRNFFSPVEARIVHRYEPTADKISRHLPQNTLLIIQHQAYSYW